MFQSEIKGDLQVSMNNILKSLAIYVLWGKSLTTIYHTSSVQWGQIA